MAMISGTGQSSQDARTPAYRTVTIIRKDGSRKEVLFDRSRQSRAEYLQDQARFRDGAGK